MSNFREAAFTYLRGEKVLSQIKATEHGSVENALQSLFNLELPSAADSLDVRDFWRSILILSHCPVPDDVDELEKLAMDVFGQEFARESLHKISVQLILAEKGGTIYISRLDLSFARQGMADWLESFPDSPEIIRMLRTIEAMDKLLGKEALSLEVSAADPGNKNVN